MSGGVHAASFGSATQEEPYRPRDVCAAAVERPLRIRGTRSLSTINVLTLSSLYPNREMPYHGIFVENRLRHLVESGKVAALVVAPIPWFPVKSERFGRYATFARVPREEQRHGLTVSDPRHFLIPQVGMPLAPLLMYWSLARYLDKVLTGHFRFDLIDAHYFYPVAAVMLGRRLGKPVVITARGTKVNLIADYRLPPRWIRWAAARADGMVAVSEALRVRASPGSCRGSDPTGAQAQGMRDRRDPCFQMMARSSVPGFAVVDDLMLAQ